MKKIILAILAIASLAASCNFASSPTVGIVKTANGGIDWQGANKIANTDKSLLERSISQMHYNGAGDKIYASSYSGGLFYSEDAAENWTEVLGTVPLYDFVFNPFDDQTIYAAAYLSGKGRVFVTRDGAKSWTEIYSDAGESNPVRAIGINPNNGRELIIGTGKGSIIRSNDEGATWELVENLNDRINRIYWTDNGLYLISQRKGLFRSETGGSNFDLISDNLRTPSRENDVFLYGGRPNDFRQLAVDPSNPDSLWLTTNHGLFASRNGGRSWNYANMPYRQQDASPFAIAFAQTGDQVIYASSGPVIFKSVDNGNSWTTSDTRTNGLVTAILVSEVLPQIAFAGVSE